jgi:hypothetical protein
MNDMRDDSEDFSLKRQDRAGRDPGTDKSGEDSAAKSESADKSSSTTIDDNALPDRIRRKYYVVANEPRKDEADGEARLYADQRGEYLAFKVTEDRLVTRLAAAEVVRDMVSVAQHRRWDALNVRGSAEFRREAWLEAGARGIGISRPILIGRHSSIGRKSGTDHIPARTRRRFIRFMTGASARKDLTTTRVSQVA